MRRGVKDILEGTGPIRVPKWAMDLYEDIFDDPERDRYYEETDYERLLTIAYAIQWKHPELRLGQTIYVFSRKNFFFLLKMRFPFPCKVSFILAAN